jgi:hypothetical protein
MMTLAISMLSLAPSFIAPTAKLAVKPRSSAPHSMIDWNFRTTEIGWNHFVAQEPQLGTSWEEVEAMVATNNLREDAFGMVGGTYAALDWTVVITVLACLALYLRTQKPQDDSNDVDFSWQDGLPSLAELAQGCAVITDPEAVGQSWFLCLTPATEGCSLDDKYSDYYGRPVYVCAM